MQLQLVPLLVSLWLIMRIGISIALTLLVGILLVTATPSYSQQSVAEKVCNIQAGGQDDELTLLQLQHETTPSYSQQSVAEKACSTQAGGQEDELTLLQLQHETKPIKVMSHRASSRIACASLGVCFATLLAGLSVRWARVDGSVEVARSFLVLLAGYNMMCYSIVILDSYQLSIALSKHATFSGLMISVYQLGAGIGSCVMWCLLKCRPILWKQSSGSVLLFALLVHLLGAVGYTMACERMSHSASTKWLPALLVSSRLVSGIGGGSWLQLGDMSIARLSPHNQRPYHIGRAILAATVGLGLGPVISALCSSIISGAAASAAAVDFAVSGILQVVMTVVMSIAIACYFPDLTGATDFLQGEETMRNGSSNNCVDNRSNEKGSTWLGQAVVVAACIAMTACRAFGASSLEVATSLLLEVKYKWRPRAVGLAMAIPAFGTVPLRLAQQTLVGQFTAVSWIRLLSCVCLLSALLLSLVERAVWIVALDCVVFPLLYWSEAQSTGIMQQHFFPEGSWLDANNATLLRLLVCNAAGRFLGPIAARWQIIRGGLDMYSVQQVLVIGMFWGVFELAVNPNMKCVVLLTEDASTNPLRPSAALSRTEATPSDDPQRGPEGRTEEGGATEEAPGAGAPGPRGAG